jgi:pilus assembly protein CpaC
MTPFLAIAATPNDNRPNNIFSKINTEIISIQKKEIRLELGERIFVKNILNQKIGTVWIEHKNTIQLEQNRNNISLFAKNLGFTQLRINQIYFRVYVMPPSTRFGFKSWNASLFENSKFLDYCGIFLCYSGKLDSFNQYRNILSLMPQNLVPVFFTDTPDRKVRLEIEKFVAKELRAEGLTPQKLVFGRTWRMFYFSSSGNEFLRKKLNSLGIELYVGKQYTELAENIEVEVKVIEASHNFLRKWGLSWPSQIQSQGNVNTGVFEIQNIEAALNFAESEGDAKIIASPRLVTRNEKTAEFFAGGEIPVRISNHKSSRIEWRKFGIALKIKPKLDSLGQFSIEIETEVSSLNNAFKIEDIPAIQISRTLSHFDLSESKTLSLSGLIRNENSRSSDGVAFLKNIPILGELFQSRSFIENKTELIILVTPRLSESDGVLK